MVHEESRGRDDVPLHPAGGAPLTPKVFVVDDDDALRDSLRALLGSAGFRCEGYASAAEFLAAYRDEAGCLLLDVRMPGMSGLRLQDQLAERGVPIPIVFVTGHGDVPMAVEAMRKGAFDFLEKPYADEELLDRVRRAIASDASRRREEEERRAAEAALEALTAREREVLDCLLAGRTGRATAQQLGITEKTVEFHRSRIMQKLQMRTREQLFELCRRARVFPQ
ncbi:MAG: response regulator transcription factor [Betaproteobacteria bacterium]|nr:response regulator transcription factor [Betaproteobacteria bacterium]